MIRWPSFEAAQGDPRECASCGWSLFEHTYTEHTCPASRDQAKLNRGDSRWGVAVEFFKLLGA